MTRPTSNGDATMRLLRSSVDVIARRLTSGGLATEEVAEDQHWFDLSLNLTAPLV